MRTELVSIPAPHLPLDGAWYLPDGPATGAALLLHGNTMNFYTGAPRFLPPALTGLGLACLAFNRSGHDILAIRDSREAEGGAFQTAAGELADVAAAARWLRERGHDRQVVIGHSNGGMLAAAHVAAEESATALVLLSAHVGGKDILRLQCEAGQLAADRLPETLARAERLVREGRGRQLMLVPGWWYVLSAESLLDRLHGTPDLLEAAARITCPVLFLRGDQESPEVYPAERFREATGGPCDVQIVADCDHFYRGREDAVTDVVAGWLHRTLDRGGDHARVRT